jgi:hypothetical protein
MTSSADAANAFPEPKSRAAAASVAETNLTALKAAFFRAEMIFIKNQIEKLSFSHNRIWLIITLIFLLTPFTYAVACFAFNSSGVNLAFFISVDKHPITSSAHDPADGV